MSIKIITVKELREKLESEYEDSPIVEMDGRRYKAGIPWQITDVKKETHNGEVCVIIYQVNAVGEEYGVILDKQYAAELTKSLGPHPLVEEFFRVH